MVIRSIIYNLSITFNRAIKFRIQAGDNVTSSDKFYRPWRTADTAQRRTAPGALSGEMDYGSARATVTRNSVNGSR
ncbi:hypothetical protein EVAR_81361_1 [Eumeta japonica]|uniref:Uncharacterized protein n=1 Tax=Eumeta variegata TaxID=151549 RepID=A0A4C1XDF9_EUMVA|nr:hypothetical protein EVAR_81361_1 [Eumeta japonica]